MRPFAAMGALNLRIATCPPAKSTSPVSALTLWSWPSPSAPTTQITASAPPPVVLAMGDPRPFTPAHQAVGAAAGGPAPMRSATSPLAPGQFVHCAAAAWHGHGLVCYASSGKEGNRRLPEHALYDLRSRAVPVLLLLAAAAHAEDDPPGTV